MGGSPLIQDLRFNRLWHYEKNAYSITEGVIKWKTKRKSNSAREQV